MTNTNDVKPNKKKYHLWALLSLCIAILTITVIFSLSKTMTPEELLHIVDHAKPGWLTMAVVSMLGYIFFEGQSLKTLLRSMDYRTTNRQATVYGAADVFFSAITPSASGGQPAIIYFMMKNGISVARATAVLVFNLTFYTFASLLVSLIAVLLRPGFFFHFSFPSRILIVAGTVVILILGICFILLMKKGDLISKIMNKLVTILGNMRIIRKPEKWFKKIENIAIEYNDAATLMSGKTAVAIKVALCNLGQKLSLTLVPVFMDLAIKGSTGQPLSVWATQCYVSLGNSSIPIPGAMGLSDYLMIDGFGKLMDQHRVFRLELLSRGTAFYFCVFVAGIIVLLAYLRIRRKEEK